MSAKRPWMVGAALLGLVVLAGFGCSPLEDESEAPNRLIVVSISTENVSGATGVLESDVITKGSVVEDVAGVTFRNDFINLAFTPTSLNDLIVTRYRVTYERSDGQNQPGVDVPFPFDGTMNVLVPVNEEGSGEFTLVRASAKLEEPLVSLQYLGAGTEIATTARIEFWAHDLFGRVVRTTATYPVNFANWADE